MPIRLATCCVFVGNPKRGCLRAHSVAPTNTTQRYQHTHSSATRAAVDGASASRMHERGVFAAMHHTGACLTNCRVTWS
jgi:hypothetical protein